MSVRIAGRLLFVFLFTFLAAMLAADQRPTNVDPACPDCALKTAAECPFCRTLDNRLWHLDRLDQTDPAPDYNYSSCIKGTGVTVFVVDTGVMRKHSEFGDTDAEQRARVADGWDFSWNVSLENLTPALNRTAANPCQGWLPSTSFDNGAHGTSVASLVAGKRVGIAPGVKIVPIKVTPCEATAKEWEPERTYEEGDLVSLGAGRAFVCTKSGMSGKTRPAVSADTAAVSDGTCEWTRQGPPAAVRSQPAAMRAAVDFLTTEVGKHLPAVVTFSTYVDPPPDAGAPNCAGTLEGQAGEWCAFRASLEAFVRANPRVPVFASANNKGAPACAQLPAALGSDKKVFTVGGSMLRNSPDQAVYGGINGEYEPVYDEARGTKDARWITAAGGDSNVGELGSNYGRCVTAFAPAKNITSAKISHAFDYRDRTSASGVASGTSWSAPLAAGIAARYLQMNGGASAADVYDALKQNALAGVLVEPDLNPTEPPAENNNLLLRAADVMFKKQPCGPPSAADPCPGFTVPNNTASLTLSAEAVSVLPLEYEWWQERYNFADLTDATPDQPVKLAANGGTVNVTPERNSVYYVIVKGPASSACVLQPAKSRRVRVTVGGACTVTLSTNAPIATTATGTPDITLTIDAVGATRYRWYSGERGDTGDFVGQTNGNSFVLTGARNINDAKYWVRAINLDAKCFVDSEPVPVKVKPSFRSVPPLRLAPNGGLGEVGRLTVLTVEARGDNHVYKYPNLNKPTFAWYFSTTTPDVETTSPTCTTSTCRYELNAAPGDKRHYYSVFITTPHGNPAELRGQVHVCKDKVALLWQPPEESARTVAATPGLKLVAQTAEAATTPLRYQWYRGDRAGASQKIEGATGREFVVPTIYGKERFWTKVWKDIPGYDDSEDEACAAQTLSTIVKPCTVRITKQPYRAGDRYVVETAGTAENLKYQWFRGNPGDVTNPVPDGNGHTLAVPYDSTRYWVRISTNSPNAVCSVDSAVILRRKIRACCRTLTEPTKSAALRVDNPADFESSVVFDWYNADNVLVATGEEVWLAAERTTDFHAEARNDTTIEASDAVTLVIDPEPEITVSPSGVVRPNTEVTLTVSMAGATRYQWYTGTSYYFSDELDEHGAILRVRPMATQSYWVTVWDRAGNEHKSAIIEVVVGCDTMFVTMLAEPLTTLLVRGEPIKLTAFTGGQPTGYSWYRGETGDTSHFEADSPAMWVNPQSDAARYWVRAFDLCGKTADSEDRLFYVCIPRITSQPSTDDADGIVPVQSAVKLRIAATSSNQKPIAVKWYRGIPNDRSNPVPNGDAAEVPITATESATYWASVTGTCYDPANPTDPGTPYAISSSAVNVTVCTAPQVTTLTTALEVEMGAPATLRVDAAGENLSYLWYRGQPGDPASVLAATTTVPTWTFNAGNNTTYWVQVRSHNTCTANSAAMVVTVCAKPAISEQPQPRNVFSGGRAALSVTASSSTSHTLTYHWYDAAGTMVGSGREFTTPPLTANAEFRVRVTGGSCETYSNWVMVSVCPLAEVLPAAPGHETTPTQQVMLQLPSYGAGVTYRFYQGASGVTSMPLGPQQTTNYFYVSPATTTQYWAEVVSGGCTSRTAATTVNVCVPQITQQPASEMIDPGQSRTLTVAATTSGLTYQWFYGTSGNTAAPIANATGSSLPVSPSATTSYWVRVTSSCGRIVNSNTATISLCQPPAVTNHPANASIARGQSATLSVAASGTNVTYQWYEGAVGNAATPAGTGASINVAPQNPTSYWARATGRCGTANSNAATVTVCAPPAIAAQPQSQSVFSGNSVTVSVAASQPTGIGMTQQWYIGAAGDMTQPIAGATGTSLNTGALTSSRSYWVRIVSGTCVTNSATATVSICPLPAVVGGMADVQTTVGQLVRLQVPPMNGATAYAWYRGASGDKSAPLSGQQAHNYHDVAPSVTTQYWAEVFNGGCVSSTTTTTVRVCVPQATQQPAGRTINAGQTETLTFTANTAGVTYQWYVGAAGNTASPIGGATGSSLTVAPSVTTTYWARATSACGRAIDSVAATVTICQVPAITGNPQNASIARGQSVTLYASASGTSVTYQWYQGNSGDTSVPTGTGSSLTVSPQNPTNYWVRANGMCGSANSSTATVSVCATPSFSVTPQSRWIFSGDSASLTVSASQPTGLGVTYQWFSGASGDTSAPLGSGTTYPTGALTTERSYWVRATSGVCAADTPTATISICPLTAVVTGAADRQIAPNQGTVLQLGPMQGATSFIWYRGASGDKSAPLTGQQASNSLEVFPIGTTQYWAEVFNGGCVSRTTTTTVSVCVPQVTQQPSGSTIAPGQTATLTFAANTAGVTYQWYVGATGNTASPIGGATGTSLTVSPAATTSYWARATSSCGRTIDSVTATVTVCATTAITAQPGNAMPVPRFSTSTLSVTANGSNLTYQWYVGQPGNTGSALSGATGRTLVINSTNATEYYWVRVTGACGTVDSAAGLISVYPSIQSQPQSTPVAAGGTAEFAVNAFGSYLRYQWYEGGDRSRPVGTNSPLLSIGPIYDERSFYCVVTSGTAETITYPVTATPEY